MHKTVERTPVYNAGIQGNEAAVSQSMPKVHDSKLDSPVSTYPSLNINQSTEEKATTRTSKLRRAKNFLSILLDICSVLSIWIPKNTALKKFKTSPTFGNNKSGSNNQYHIAFEHTKQAIHKYIQIFEVMKCIRFEDLTEFSYVLK